MSCENCQRGVCVLSIQFIQMNLNSSDLIRTIFSSNEAFCEDATTYEYLSKIGNLTFEQILSEPLCLNDEMKNLTEQTQELALTNYRTFVETAECSNKILKDFDASKTILNELLEKIPTFTGECEHFSISSKEILKQKSSIDLIKFQSEEVLSILELPILMQKALNDADYESALDLFTYIRNLARKYNDLPALQNITSEATKMWFEALYRLFNQLRYDLPLPQCLQVLGYLRRANIVYETTIDDLNSGLMDPNFFTKSNKVKNVGDGLQLHFLKARGNWFDSALTDALTDEDEKQLRKIVELHRIHLFNILTQHKAIFLADTQGTKIKNDELNGIAALSCWLKEKVHKLTAVLEQNIHQEDDASFESLFSQCMYLCLSFGRLGADIRGVIAPLFRNVISKNFSRTITKSDSQFEAEMKIYKMSFHNKIIKKTIEDTDHNQNSPPESLLEFYPLAEYCNNLLCAMNTLRMIAPLSLAKVVVDEISHSLVNVATVMIAFHNREQQTFSEPEQDLFINYCNTFINELIPYLQKCINQIFSPTLIAEHLGISLTTLQDEKLLVINSERISLILNEVLSISKA